MSDKSIEQDYEAIKKDVSQLRSDIAVLLQSAKESGQEGLGKAKEDAEERLKENTDKLARQAREVGDRIETQYEERPLIFMIGAFLIGIILGRLFSKKAE